MAERHATTDLRVPSETGWRDGSLEEHLNGVHEQRLNDLMVMSFDDKVDLHVRFHSAVASNIHTIRCLFIKADITGKGVPVDLEEGERIVNIDHRGNDVWVYVERDNNG